MQGRDLSAVAEIKIRMKEPLRAAIEHAAKRRGVSMNAEMIDRLDASFAETAYPAEVAALAELIARAMAETGSSIEGMNRWSDHGYLPWLDDPYAYDQAAKAALWVLVQSRPTGSRAPHGLFATDDFIRRGLSGRMGKQIADGILELMRGRLTDNQGEPTPAPPWMERVRAKLGAIWERLANRPVPAAYWGPPKRVPGRTVLKPTADPRVFSIHVEPALDGEEPGEKERT